MESGRDLVQVARSIESGVAQAAALATTASADDLANELHERMQRASPSSSAITPTSPAGLWSTHSSHPAAVRRALQKTPA